MALPNLE